MSRLLQCQAARGGKPSVGVDFRALPGPPGTPPVDEEVMAMLDEAAVSYHLVLTKGDKIKPTELAAVLARTSDQARTHPAAHPTIFTTSSETTSGIAELRTAIIEAAL